MAHRIEALRISKQLKKAAEFLQDEECFKLAGPGGFWGVRNSGLDSYQKSFSDVLRVPITHSVEQTRRNGSEVYGLDLMGEAQVLIDLGIKGLGVTVIDGRDDTTKANDQQIGIDILASTFNQDGTVLEICDIFTNRTRRHIREYVKNHNIPGFNLILCRPLAALDCFPKQVSTCYFLLNEFWKMLTPNGGMLLTEIPMSMHSEMDTLADFLKENNIDTESNPYGRWPFYVLRLSRDKNSPKNLPGIDTTV